VKPTARIAGGATAPRLVAKLSDTCTAWVLPVLISSRQTPLVPHFHKSHSKRSYKNISSKITARKPAILQCPGLQPNWTTEEQLTNFTITNRRPLYRKKSIFHWPVVINYCAEPKVLDLGLYLLILPSYIKASSLKLP